MKEGKALSLTKGWETKKLGEVCEIYQPTTISKKNMVSDGEFPVFGANGIIGKYDKYNHEESQLLITCRGATCGSVNISLPKSWINGNAMVVKPINDSLSRNFLEYLFRGGIYVSNVITGAAQPQITRQNLSPIEIPIPPLSEQKRIVSILDRAFSLIEQSRNNAEQNLKNAKELFESYLQGVFENKGEDWQKTSLDKEIDLITGFAFKSKEYTENPEDIFLLRGDNIMQGYLRLENIKRWRKIDAKQYQRYELAENDIVLAMDRPWVSAGLKCAKLSTKDLPALLVQRTACLRNKNNLNNSFLFHLVKSAIFMKYLISVQTGIGVPHISGNQILNFKFTKPPYDEQIIISKTLDFLSSETKNLEAIYLKKINDLEELKKSVLHKAFNGEL